MAVVPLLARRIQYTYDLLQALVGERGPALQDEQIQAVLELGDGHFAAPVVVHVRPERLEVRILHVWQ